MTKLMDIFATVRLDSRESTVKQVCIPSKLEFSINLTNHIFILYGMELARAKGAPVTQRWTCQADTGQRTWLGF